MSAEERIPLEQRMQEAREEKRAAAYRANKLYAEHGRELVECARVLIEMLDCGDEGYGYQRVNPSLSAAERIKAGEYDDVPMPQFNDLVDDISWFSDLWEGRREQPELAIARNLLVKIVLSQNELREHVFSDMRHACEMLRESLKEANVRL